MGEIEYAASKAPGVVSAVADIIKGTISVFCLAKGGTIVHDVRKACREWLPLFMVPADIMLLDTLPYLPSGKIDRKALQSLHSEKTLLSSSKDGEMFSTTTRVAEIVSNVLRYPVNSLTQLPAIGLDSLQCIRIASRLQRAGFPQLDAGLLLQSETIGDVECQLRQLEDSFISDFVEEEGSNSVVEYSETSSTLR